MEKTTVTFITTYKGHEHLLIIGMAGIILSDDECIHRVFLWDELETLVCVDTIEDNEDSVVYGYEEISLLDLLWFPCCEVDAGDIEDWISYFGIKSRIRTNFSILRETSWQIGINPHVILPNWR